MVCRVGTSHQDLITMTMSSQAHLEPGDGQGCLLLVEELGQHKVPRLHDGAEVHVQVGELVVLQGRAVGPLGVSNPLVKIVIRVGKVLNLRVFGCSKGDSYSPEAHVCSLSPPSAGCSPPEVHCSISGSLLSPTKQLTSKPRM